MKLQYASDLHLEFPENKELLDQRPIRPEGDILILGGDIVPFRYLNLYSDFFDYISDKFATTYWIPGNHEYYHSDLSERGLILNEKIRENIFLVNNTSVVTNNTKLVFSTLWSRISKTHQFEIVLQYSDFHYIRNNGKLIDIDEYNRMHEQCRSFLTEEISNKSPGKLIIVTHHLPTLTNYPEEYIGNPLSEAFATELSDLIKAAGPDYWIFGHHHTNRGDFNVGRTRLVTNQLGYVMYNEHRKYSDERYIDI
ncbi:MAG: metallophosphoesterase [Bacteroidota bacterium]|nr:metallophosphoesterase [Bacteroidota bacterium]